MQRIRFHHDASNEIENAAAYINKDKPGVGDEFLKEIQESVLALARNPTLWAVKKWGFRKHVTKRFRYLIWYKEEKDGIYIVSVHHGSRRPGHWKDRILDE